METLQALHVIYKLAILSTTFLTLCYFVSGSVFSWLLKEYGLKVSRFAGTIVGIVCLGAWVSIAVAVVYFFVQLF